MGEARRRLLNGENLAQEIARKTNWEYQKHLQKAFKKAKRFVRGKFNPATGEIK
jgi:AraC-like DNA-binding protein